MMLSGLKCVEVHLGDAPLAVRYAGKLLAGLGAQVDALRVSSSGLPTRSSGPVDHRFEAFLSMGKGEAVARSELTVDEALDELAMAEPAIILIGHEGGLNSVVRRFVDAQENLLYRSEVVVVSPFGLTGPKAEWFGSSLVGLAAGGSAFYQPAGVTDPDHERPLQIGQYAGDLAAGVTALVAALANLFDSVGTQAGCADVSVHESVLAMGLLNSSWVTHTGISPSRVEAAGRRGASLGLLRCADGLFSLLPIHESQWDRWVEVMGDPAWAASPLYATKDARSANKDALQHMIEEWALDYTKAEIWRMGQAANVPVFPVHTPREVLSDRQMIARGFFERLPPTEGADLGVVPRSPLRSISPASVPGSGGSKQSLDGLKVLDLSWVLAGPHATSWLGYMGADVIRVESAKRLDQFRANPPFRVGRDPDQAGGFHHINQNKRSIAIDLKHPEAGELVLRLAEHADVLVENFGAGMMERFGLSESALRERRPDLVIASSSGLGRSGPDGGMRAYGQTIHAYAGLAGRVGYAPHDVRGIVGTWADPLTGVFQVGAILAALHHRCNTGSGVNIDLSMAEGAIFGTIPDVFVDAGAGHFEEELAENRSRRHVLNEVIRCAGDHEWIAISLRDESQLGGLREILGLSPTTEVPERLDLERASLNWEAEPLAEALQGAGIAAHRVSDAGAAISDPHGIARRMISTVDDPDGAYPIATMPWRRARAGREVEWPLRPAPRLGEHTSEVLKHWLNMSPGEIESFRTAGVLQ